MNSQTLPSARLVLDKTLGVIAPTPPDTRVHPIRAGSVQGEWVRGPGSDRTDAAVLYVHGGGFVAGSARGYRGLASRLSVATRLPVFSLDYRLAPEHPLPAPQHDVSAAYRWLVRQGLPPEKIVVAGDSAGGFLATDFVLSGAKSHHPPPAALALFSPITDLGRILAGEFDAVRNGKATCELCRQAVTGATPSPVRLSPKPGDRLPPLLIHAGATEFFRHDALRLTGLWAEAGGNCELRLWRNQMHVFQAIPIIPESRTAIHDTARFISTRLEPPASERKNDTPPSSTAASRKIAGSAR